MDLILPIYDFVISWIAHLESVGSLNYIGLLSVDTFHCMYQNTVLCAYCIIADLLRKVLQCSVAQVSDPLRPYEPQHVRPLYPSPTPGIHPNPRPLSRWCHPTISSSIVPFLPSVFPSISVFSNESVLHIRWPEYWSFSFSPSNEYSRLISFRINWFDLLAVRGTLKSRFQHDSSKAWILRRSAFFIVQVSHPYMTTGKTIALIRRILLTKWCLFNL